MSCQHLRSQTLIYDARCLECGARRVRAGFWVAPEEPALSARERRLVEATAEVDRIWSEERFDRGNFAVWLRQFENAMHAAHAALAAYDHEPAPEPDRP